MGELADRIDDFNRKLDSDTLSAIASAVAELESRIPQLEQLIGKQSDRIIAGQSTETEVAQAVFRAAAAEKRADGLLAALNHVVPCEGAMLELHEIRARRDERVTIGGIDADWYNIFNDKPLLIAVIGPRQPPNPDLLERRGLELIEAGERLLAEYKQQQETARKQQEASNG